MGKTESELVEGNNIHGLDIILESFNPLLDIIGGYLLVLDSGADLDLEDAISNGLLLPLGLPHQAVHLDGEDLVSEDLQVGFLTPRLNLPDDERLGDGGSLLRLGLTSSGLGLKGFCSSGISLGIGIKKIIELFLSSSRLSSSLRLLLLASFASFLCL